MENKPVDLLNRTKKIAWLLLAFILLMWWCGLVLVTAESPDQWKEAEITVSDVQFISGKLSRYELTDIKGNTYSISSSNKNIHQIIPGTTYHIIFSEHYRNGIRSMENDRCTIVDYEQSIADFSERGPLVWILFFTGLCGTLATIVIMIANIRKNIKTPR